MPNQVRHKSEGAVVGFLSACYWIGSNIEVLESHLHAEQLLTGDHWVPQTLQFVTGKDRLQSDFLPEDNLECIAGTDIPRYDIAAVVGPALAYRYDTFF